MTQSARCCIFLCTVCLLATPLVAQTTDKEKAPQAQQSPNQEEMMKKWAAMAMPTDAHKKLDDLVGTWDLEVKTWMNGPAGTPTITKGSSTYAWVLGGRFLRQDMKGEMMGMPLEGIGYTGYDNYNKKYLEFWIDNSSTAMFTASGFVDQSGKVFTFYGTMDEWMTGENGKPVKYVARILSKDKNVFEIHDLAIGGADTKVVEMTYTRKSR
jgi:hypothetical protein